jgi:hypothetical protein
MADSVRVVGGLRYRGYASWPLAELVIDRERIVIQLRLPILRRLFGRWLPSIDVPVSQVVAAEFIRGPVFAMDGLRLVSSQPSVIFRFLRGRDREAAREALEDGGVLVRWSGS